MDIQNEKLNTKNWLIPCPLITTSIQLYKRETEREIQREESRTKKHNHNSLLAIENLLNNRLITIEYRIV